MLFFAVSLTFFADALSSHAILIRQAFRRLFRCCRHPPLPLFDAAAATPPYAAAAAIFVTPLPRFRRS